MPETREEDRPIERDATQERAGHTPDAKRRLSPLGHLLKFIGWWCGFTGLYAVFATCPFCGAVGCPVGIASAGTVGGFLALLVQDWRRLISYLRNRRRTGEPETRHEHTHDDSAQQEAASKGTDDE